MTETLTDEERVYVGHHALSAGKKALCIIDAHAADRAALVAELEAARAALVEAQTVGVFCSGDEDERPRLRAQVAELTRERNEARVECEKHRQMSISARMLLAEDQALESQVANLTRERDSWRRTAETLTRERDEARENEMFHRERYAKQVTRLTEALAEAEREKREHGQRWLAAEREAMAAEARVRELEALLTTAEAESRAQKERADDWETIAARDFQLAADWKARCEAAEVDAAVAKDRLAALQAKVERAIEHFAISYGSSPFHWPEAVRAALETLHG